MSDPKAPEPAAPKKWAKPGDQPPDGVKLPTATASPADQIPPPPSWWKTLRADPPAAIRFALGVAFLAFLFLIWWLVTSGKDPTVSPNLMPSPGDTFGSFSKLNSRGLGESTADTLVRVMKGITLAAVVGVVLGILAGAYRGLNAALTPFIIFLRSVPMGALIPITLALFGTGEEQKVRFIFLAVVPFVFSDTLKAVSIVPERYVETAKTLGASNLQIIYKVLVPLALPDIVTSLRFMFGLALGYIMLVEESLTEHGLGQLMFGSQRQGLPEQLWLLLFVIAALALCIDLVLRTIQRGVFPWRRDL